MTRDHLSALLRKYQVMLNAHGSKNQRHSLSALLPTKRDVVSHLGWMLGEMRSHTEEQWDKSMRWLGFIQGSMWVLGIYTVDQLKEDNR